MVVDYITAHDPLDIRTWSGLNYFIRKSLMDQGVTVNIISKLHARPDFGLKWRYHFYRWFGKNYQYERTDCYAKQFGDEVNRRLNSDADIILSTTAAVLPYIETNKPVVLYTDATFDNLAEYYTHFSRLPASSKRMADRLEAKSFEKCAAIIFSSEWAAASAKNYYGAEKEKVYMVPFGANLKKIPDTRFIRSAIGRREMDGIKLLWSAVEYKRKGGDLALEVAALLRKNGYPASIDFVGITESQIGDLPPYARAYGFLDKSKQDDEQQMESLFLNAHFFLLPTSMDCSPVVLSEANAFGVPCLTSNISGLDSIIRPGLNGFSFPLNASANDYAHKIMEIVEDVKYYQQLAVSSREEFENRLNWNTSGVQIMKILKGLVAPEPAIAIAGI